MDSKTSFKGTEKIIESWVGLYTDYLYKWALFKTSDKECAEDLVQDTFLSAYQQLDKFGEKSSPKTWLVAILNNKISGYYRTKYKAVSDKVTRSNDSPIFTQLFDENDRWKNEEKPSAWQGDQPHLLDDPDFNGVLSSCMHRLPEQWRLAVNLKYLEEARGSLICQELDIAPTNFWQILHRAKLQLRKCLEVNWFKA